MIGLSTNSLKRRVDEWGVGNPAKCFRLEPVESGIWLIRTLWSGPSAKSTSHAFVSLTLAEDHQEPFVIVGTGLLVEESD